MLRELCKSMIRALKKCFIVSFLFIVGAGLSGAVIAERASKVLGLKVIFIPFHKLGNHLI